MGARGLAQSGKRQDPHPNPQEQLTALDATGALERRLHELDHQIHSPETDWDSLYLRLKFSPLGVDFTPERFLATPVRTLQWLTAKLNEYEQRQQNLAAYPTAILNTQVMWGLYGMGGGKGPKPQADYKDFLPFPEAQKQIQSEADAAQLQETRAALRRALATRLLPYDIFIELWRGPRD